MSASEPLTPTLTTSPRGQRILWLCAPSWGAALWLVLLVIVTRLHLMPLRHVLLSKPVTMLATITSMGAPICWLIAIFLAFGPRPTTRIQQIVLTLSLIAIAVTWIVLIHVIRHK